MKNSVCNQTTEVTKDKSVVFKLWCQLLAKRKNSISIKILCIFLITIATVVTWMIQFLLNFMANLPEGAVAEVSAEADESAHDDPFGDFSMSLNGWD